VKNAFEAVRGRDIIKDKIVAGSRLARFNVTAEALADTETRKVKADIWFGSVRLAGATLHPLALMYAVSGSAMISATLRVPKL
jgi:CDP-diacylglycerol--serine O-phosphatidyltransferase